MNYHEPTYYRAERRTVGGIPFRKLRFVALLIAGALIAAAIGNGPSSTTTSDGSTAKASKVQADTRWSGGAMPGGTTVFDGNVPGVANLDGALRGALRRASADALDIGVKLRIDSGWRSSEYQQHLLDKAIEKYGSEVEASRWVAPPDRSAHVSGDAVDIGPQAAAAWLTAEGDAYGLCQIYDNEPWHFELRREAIEYGCPARYLDAAHDPRMQR